MSYLGPLIFFVATVLTTAALWVELPVIYGPNLDARNAALNTLAVVLTGDVIAWYTWETRRLREESELSRAESEREFQQEREWRDEGFEPIVVLTGQGSHHQSWGQGFENYYIRIYKFVLTSAALPVLQIQVHGKAEFEALLVETKKRSFLAEGDTWEFFLSVTGPLPEIDDELRSLRASNERRVELSKQPLPELSGTLEYRTILRKPRRLHFQTRCEFNEVIELTAVESR